MGAYNLYKGQHACHNQYLLNDILKGEWGFDGVVVSDWGGVHDTDQAIKNGLEMCIRDRVDTGTHDIRPADKSQNAPPTLMERFPV